MLQRNAFILLACIGLTTAWPEALHAKGLLGALLRDATAGTGRPRAQVTPADRKAMRGYQTDLQLRAGEWVTVRQSSGDTYGSVAECRRELARQAHTILKAIAFRPLAGQYIGDTALVVKEGADPESPVWKLVVLTCGGGKISTDAPLDADTREAMAASGADASQLLALATDFVRQTDGSFPPPPTAAAIAEAQRMDKFLSQVVFYDPSGAMQAGKGDQLFDTASECDRHTTAKMRAAISQTPGGAKILGKTVFLPNDGSGYVWFGCIRLRDLNTPPFAKYVDIKMTPDRARSMERFPNFTPPAPDIPEKPREKTRF